MKKQVSFIIALALIFPPNAFADCASSRAETEKKCSDSEYQKTLAHTSNMQGMVDACKGKSAGSQVSVNGLSHSCTASELNGGADETKKAIDDGNAYVERCKPAREECVSSCKQAQSNPTTQQQGAEGEQYCEGKPKENQQAAEQNNAAMMQALAALLAAMMARGQEPPASAVNTVCGPNGAMASAPTTQSTNGSDVLPTASSQAAATAAQICPTLDKATTQDSSFADGTARTSGGNDQYLGANDLSGSMNPAAGAPAQVQLSSAIPGNMGGGGMGAGAAGGSGSRESGKKGDPDGSKLNLASTPGGGGGGGGGSLAGSGGKAGASGPGVAPSRTAADNNDQRMQAALEKAAQLRGIASDGPAGGISGANALDNFQKVEKRMQSERNNLSEL